MTEAAASDAEEGYIWDVQEILAERPSISTDENEVLVVWKTAWIQKRCLIADCPAMRRWNEAAKWASCEDCCGQASLQVVLPVEPGSQMATDLAEARASLARMSKYWKMARQAGKRRAEVDGCCKASRIAVRAGELPTQKTESLDIAQPLLPLKAAGEKAIATPYHGLSSDRE